MYNPSLKYNSLNDEDFSIKTGIVVNRILTIGGLLFPLEFALILAERKVIGNHVLHFDTYLNKVLV